MKKELDLSGKAFSGMPKVSIDPTIRTPASRCHQSSETHPDSPSMRHLEIAFSAVTRVLNDLKKIWSWIEVVKIHFHLGEDNPYLVYLKCEVVVVTPLLCDKCHIWKSIPVIDKSDPPDDRNAYQIKYGLDRLVGALHVDIFAYFEHQASRFEEEVTKWAELLRSA